MKVFSISETIQNLTRNPRDKERQSKIISRDKPCPLQFNAVFRKWFYCFSFFWYAKFCPPFVPPKIFFKNLHIDIQHLTQQKYHLRGQIMAYKQPLSLIINY